jgi:hypothetical protein
VEQQAEVTMLVEGSQIGPVESSEKPYAYAPIGDRGSAEPWAYNGRGFVEDQYNERFENELVWSDATIGFQGESGYNLPSPMVFFLNSVNGRAISEVIYSLDIVPRYGGGIETAGVFAIQTYENDYLESPGWDSRQSIILRNSEGGELFSWTGDEGLQTFDIPLTAYEEYTLWIESRGDFNDTLALNEPGISGEFRTSVELLISVPEFPTVPIPVPSALLMLGTGLTVLLVQRRRRRS